MFDKDIVIETRPMIIFNIHLYIKPKCCVSCNDLTLFFLPSAPKALVTVWALIRSIRGGFEGGKFGTVSLCSSELDMSSIFSDVGHDVYVLLSRFRFIESFWVIHCSFESSCVELTCKTNSIPFNYQIFKLKTWGT